MMLYQIIEVGNINEREKYGNTQISKTVKLKTETEILDLEMIITKTNFELNFSVYQNGKECKDDDIVSYLKESFFDDIINDLDNQIPQIDI